MPGYDDDLLRVSRRLVLRRQGQRGRLSNAHIRRSISTTYYAIFHFLIEEATAGLIGSSNALRNRRRTAARAFTHAGLRRALSSVAGATVEPSVQGLFRTPNAGAGPVSVPIFAQEMAKAFLDAQAKREDADYDLNKPLSEADARLLRSRVRRAIAGWRAARSVGDRDFKGALCLLCLLKGQARREG